MNIVNIVTPAGEELVMLPKSEFDLLLEAAADAAEDAADAAAYDAAMAKFTPEMLLPAEVSALITKGDNRLKAIRKWRSLGQVDLARDVGIAQGHLSDIENGRRNLTGDLAERLATRLDVPVAWLN